MRVGKLSDYMHAFLHGQPTTVPGSWCRGDVLCGSPACRALRRAHKPTEIKMQECKICREERASRRLVSYGPQDARCTREFASAPAIFATNDIKHHVNKIRASCVRARARAEAHTFTSPGQNQCSCPPGEARSPSDQKTLAQAPRPCLR